MVCENAINVWNLKGERKSTDSHDEGVREAGGGVGDVPRELDVVVVEPAAGDDGEAVVEGDALLRE